MTNSNIQWNNPDHAPDKRKKGKKHILSVPSGMSASNYNKLLSDCAKDAGLPSFAPPSSLEECLEGAKRITKEVRAWARERINPDGTPTILTEEDKQVLKGEIFIKYFERLDSYDKDELHFLLTTYLSDATRGELGLL